MGSSRSDWRRNHDRLVAAAREVVSRVGAEASLEEVARRAGVGSATLHRHFGSRRDLLDAVFHDGVLRIAGRADELAAGGDPPVQALAVWLLDLADYLTRTRGVTAALLADPESEFNVDDTCRGLIGRSAERLVEHAAASGELAPGVHSRDLVQLTNAISLTSQGDAAQARRLLGLAFDGLLRRT